MSIFNNLPDSTLRLQDPAFYRAQVRCPLSVKLCVSNQSTSEEAIEKRILSNRSFICNKNSFNLEEILLVLEGGRVYFVKSKREIQNIKRKSKRFIFGEDVIKYKLDKKIQSSGLVSGQEMILSNVKLFMIKEFNQRFGVLRSILRREGDISLGLISSVIFEELFRGEYIFYFELFTKMNLSYVERDFGLALKAIPSLLMHLIFDLFRVDLRMRILVHMFNNVMALGPHFKINYLSIWLFAIYLMFDIETNPGPFIPHREAVCLLCNGLNLEGADSSCNCGELVSETNYLRCSYCKNDINYEYLHYEGEDFFLPSKCDCSDMRYFQFIPRRLARYVSSDVRRELLYDFCDNYTGRKRWILLEMARALDNKDEKRYLVLCKFIENRGQIGWDPIGVKEAAEKLSSTTGKATEMLSFSMQEAIKCLNENVDKIALTSENFSRPISDIAEHGFSFDFNKTIDLLKDPTYGPFYFLVVYVLLEVLHQQYEEATAIQLLKYTIGGLGVGYYGMTYFKPLVMRWISTGQSDDDSWIHLVVEGLALFTLGLKLDTSSVSNFCRTAVLFNSAVESGKKLLDRILDWFGRAMDFISDYTSINLKQWITCKDNEIHRIQKEVNELYNKYVENPMGLTVEMSESATRLSMEILNLKTSYRLVSQNNTALIAIERLSEKITTLQRYFADSGFAIGKRDEPAFFCISGSPGCGKTYFSDIIVQRVALETCALEDLVDNLQSWERSVYVWPVDNKHHDQYRGQTVTMFPDLFCQTDAEGMPGEAANLVYLVGCQPMNLLAAEIDKKQKLFMISKFIIGCTNITHIPRAMFKSIRNPDAVRRRVNKNGWYQYVNAKYAKMLGRDFVVDPDTNRIKGYEHADFLYAMLDEDKLYSLNPDRDVLPDDVWFFRRFNYTKGTFEGPEVYSQEEFLEIVVAEVKKSNTKGVHRKKQLDNIAKQILERRNAGPKKINPQIDENYVEVETDDESDQDDSESYITAVAQMDVGEYIRPMSDLGKKLKSYVSYYFSDSHLDEKLFNKLRYEYFVEVFSKCGRDVKEYKFYTFDGTWVSYMKEEHIPLEAAFWNNIRYKHEYQDFYKVGFKYMKNAFREGFQVLSKGYLWFYYQHYFADPVLGAFSYLNDNVSGMVNICSNVFFTIFKQVDQTFTYVRRLFMDDFAWKTCKEITIISIATNLGVYAAMLGIIWLISYLCGKFSSKKKKEKNKPQMDWKSDVSEENFINKYLENVYLLYVDRITKSGAVDTHHPCNLIFIGERTALIVNHGASFLKKIRDSNDESLTGISLVNFLFGSLNTSTIKYRLDDIEFVVDEELAKVDLAILKFKSGRKHACLEKLIPPRECLEYMQKKTDVLGKFVKKKLHQKLPIGVPVHVSVRMNFSGKKSDYHCVVPLRTDKGNESFDASSLPYEQWDLRGVHETFITENGDCTSPCFLVDDRKNFCTNLGWKQAQQPWLCYLHSSLQSLVPHGVPICREMFERYFNEMRTKPLVLEDSIQMNIDAYTDIFNKHIDGPQLDPFQLRQEINILDEFHGSSFVLDENFMNIGKSEIVRSPCFGIDPVTRYPARLHNFYNEEGNFVDVMRKAREPYGSNTRYINEKLFGMIMEDVTSKIMNDSSMPEFREVLTLEQVLYGDTAYKLSPPKWNSSAGFMFRLFFKKKKIKLKGRQYFVDNGVFKDEFLPFFRDLMDYHEDRLEKGLYFGNIFIDNLKDELLAKHKVKEGKTRLFCGSDFMFLIMCVRYFGAFVFWIMKNRIINGISIGVNPYGKEWESLFYYLYEFSLMALFGDYGKFDKKQKDFLMSVCLSLIDKFYGYEDTKSRFKRHQLFHEIVYSTHVVFKDGKVIFYTWTHGNTSGNLLTAIINSLVNICCLFIALCLAEMLFRGRNIWKDFDYNFRLVESCVRYNTLGDDLVATVRPQPWNTFSVVQKMIETFIGLEFTDELKGTAGDVPDYRTIFDGSYLGRKFVIFDFNGVRYITCPLRKYSVIERVQWIKGEFSPEIAISQFEEINLEMTEWGREEFELVVPRYAEICKKHYGRYPRYTDFDTAFMRVTTLANYLYSFDYLIEMDTMDDQTFEDLDKFIDRIKTVALFLSEGQKRWSGGEMSPPDVEPNSTSHSLEEVKEDESNNFQQKEGQMDGGLVNQNQGEFDLDSKVVVKSTTQFVESAPIVAGAISQSTTKVSTYVEDLTGIKDFLGKPQLLTYGAWSTAVTNNANLASGSIKSYLSSVTAWAEKIKGFNLIRGDFVITVEINASPFQQGKLLLHYLPCYTDFIAVNPGWGRMHNTALIQKVQHPHVEIDCRRSSVNFRIPYIAPTHFYALREDVYDWGTWFLDVFSSLKTGSAAPVGQGYVDYLVYGHWENVELMAPSVPQFDGECIPQMDGGKVKRKAGKVEREKVEQEGPISSGLRKVTKVCDVLTDVPVIGEVAGSVGWISDIASKVASIFGWSKPRELHGLTVVSNQSYRYAGTSEGPDISLPGGIFARNELELIDYASYTNEDEMVLRYLLNIPTYYSVVNWAYNAGQGTSLFSEALSPNEMFLQSSDVVSGHTATVKYCAPLGYLSQVFLYWRGSIIVTLKFIKTQMHSGRLQVTWTPSNSFTTAPTVSTGLLSLRAIVDIRQEDEISFELPYLVLSDYLSMAPGFDPSSGNLDIVVLNDLRAPESCADNIDMQIFFRAGKDFEFAVPKQYTDGSTAYIPQMDGIELELHGVGQDLGLPTTTIGDQSTEMHETMHAGRCVGERVLSIKSLLNRLSPIMGFGSTWSFSTLKTFVLRPWFVPACELVTGTGAIRQCSVGTDIFSFLAPMYAFYRGGMRVALYDMTNTANIIYSGNYPGPQLDSGTQPIATNTTVFNNKYANNSTVYNTAQNWPMEPVNTTETVSKTIQNLPYYSRYPFSLVTYYNSVDTPSVDRSSSKSNLCVTATTAFTDVALQRSCLDDFQLMFFIGCPPLMSAYV